MQVYLTDGWYGIPATLDHALTTLLHAGSITVGVKLVMTGAELVGREEACTPLEVRHCNGLCSKYFADLFSIIVDTNRKISLKSHQDSTSFLISNMSLTLLSKFLYECCAVAHLTVHITGARLCLVEAEL